jgi:hypothetical protein
MIMPSDGLNPDGTYDFSKKRLKRRTLKVAKKRLFVSDGYPIDKHKY